MDIEKLIETLRQHGVSCVRTYGRYCSICDEAATALSTLQAENAQLRADLEYEREHANAYHQECGQWEAENEKLRADVVRLNDLLASYQNVLVPELRSELEQVTLENNALWTYIEIVDREYRRYMDRGYIDRLDELKKVWKRGQKED